MDRITFLSLVLLILLYQITIWYIVLEESQKINTIQSIYFCSLRNYPVDVYKQTLERVLLPNQKSFDNFDLALSDIVNRLNCLVNTICSLKTVWIKSNTNKWFDRETENKIHTHDRQCKRFKLTKLHFDAKIYSVKHSPKVNLQKEKSILWVKTKKKH